MDLKELRGLMETYSEVYAPEQLDEGYQEPRLDRKAFVKHANKRSGFSLGTREDPHGWREPGMEKVAKEYAARTSSARRAKRTGKPDTYRAEKESQSKLRKEELDIFDVVLEFLQAEGYAETLEEAEWMMANLIDEEAVAIILGEEQLDEISQKTATRAFGRRGTNEFESDGDDPRDFTKSGKSKADETKRRIEKKYGKKAGKHAERAAHAGIYGRKGVYSMPKVDEEFESWVNELVEEGYDLSDYTWDEMYDIYEAEKPFPYEKVKKKQVSLRDKGGNALDRRMQMGAAVRRAKEAEKTGGSQRDAGRGWYHAKEAFESWLDEAMTNYEKNRR